MANTFHVSMYVRDLDAALSRYRRILGTEPAKVRKGYAKFELQDPPVVFSLVEGGDPGRVSHLGIRYESTGEVATEMARTQGAGVDLVQQQGVTCCYAKSDKFWVKDEDGMAWEMYTLLADVEAETADDPKLRAFLGQSSLTGAASLPVLADGEATNTCCAPGSSCA